MDDECRSLWEPQEGFQPAVAERIAACWVTLDKKRTRCRSAPMAKCIRDAIDDVTEAEGVAGSCDALLDACKKRKLTPKYSHGECVKMLSAVFGRTRTDAIQQLGPTAEGCSREYALPYYPYNTHSWR